jgi:GT2 family glycosyltransferase
MTSQDTSTKSKLDLSIVLVCWNNKDYLGPCLESLYQSNLGSSFEVIAVDNGSTDGSQEMLHEKFPDVKLIQNDHNLGLGKASNQGIQVSSGEFILLLNNDTLVNKKAIEAMVALMRTNKDAGAVGGKLLNEDRTFQSGYGRFSTLWEEFLITIRVGELLWDGYPLHFDSNNIKQVSWMSSACLLVRREALNQIGLLNEEYFIYGDETDLQYRMKKAGWKAFYIPDATTIHYGGRSMDRWKRRRMVYRGKMLFYKKNYGWIRTTALRIMLAMFSFLKMVIWCILWISPKRRARAKLELLSNVDVLKICWQLK